MGCRDAIVTEGMGKGEMAGPGERRTSHSVGPEEHVCCSVCFWRQGGSKGGGAWYPHSCYPWLCQAQARYIIFVWELTYWNPSCGGIVFLTVSLRRSSKLSHTSAVEIEQQPTLQLNYIT